MTQIKCPVSIRTVLLKVGGGCLLFGAATAIFVIGIPFLVLGVPIMIVGLLWPRSPKMQCRACKFQFSK